VGRGKRRMFAKGKRSLVNFIEGVFREGISYYSGQEGELKEGKEEEGKEGEERRRRRREEGEGGEGET